MKFRVCLWLILVSLNINFSSEAIKQHGHKRSQSYFNLRTREESLPSPSTSAPIERSENNCDELEADVVDRFSFFEEMEKYESPYEKANKNLIPEELLTLNKVTLKNLQDPVIDATMNLFQAVSIVAAMINSGYFLILKDTDICRSALNLVFPMEQNDDLYYKLGKKLLEIESSNNEVFLLIQEDLEENTKFSNVALFRKAINALSKVKVADYNLFANMRNSLIRLEDAEHKFFSRISRELLNIKSEEDWINIYKFGIFELALKGKANLFAHLLGENKNYLNCKEFHKDGIMTVFKNLDIEKMVADYEEEFIKNLENGGLIPDSIFIKNDSDFQKLQKILPEDKHKFKTAIIGHEVTKIPENAFANGFMYSFHEETAFPKAKSSQKIFSKHCISSDIRIGRDGSFWGNEEEYSSYCICRLLAGEDSPIMNIEEMAFAGNCAIQEVCIPNLVNIGEKAFYGDRMISWNLANLKLLKGKSKKLRSSSKRIYEPYSSYVSKKEAVEVTTYNSVLDYSCGTNCNLVNISHEFEYFNANMFLDYLFVNELKIFKKLESIKKFYEKIQFVTGLNNLRGLYSNLDNCIYNILLIESCKYGKEILFANNEEPIENINEVLTWKTTSMECMKKLEEYEKEPIERINNRKNYIDELIGHIEINYEGDNSKKDINILGKCLTHLKSLEQIKKFISKKHEFKIPVCLSDEEKAKNAVLATCTSYIGN